jgi:hypothetical protein
MIFEIAGFLAGMAAIGVALALLYLRDSSRVLGSFYAGRSARSGRGNALIWPSR